MITQTIQSNGDSLQDLFGRYAGSDGVIDYRELQQILNAAFTAG
jgi:hypothetical protein